MTIHIVEQGDTVNSIAQKYNIPITRLLKDNELVSGEPLNIGRSLIIAYPEQTYIIQKGDTLSHIEELFGVSLIQLLRNNPQLSDWDTLIEGEELVISYNNKEKKIEVNGFANSFINLDILKKTLPFLTYITILNYRVNEDGSLNGITDTEIIEMAKAYGVAPLMFVSGVDLYGHGSYGVSHNILIKQDIQNTLIIKILSILKLKGYYGLYLGFQQILTSDIPIYDDFISKITKQLNAEGFQVFMSLIPGTYGFQAGVPYENSNIADIGNAVNYVTLITHQWTTSSIPQFQETTPGFLRAYLDYVVTQIPAEKIFIGATRIGYDWELPYVEGETLGRFLTNAAAYTLNEEVGAPILFDDITYTPYFYYNSLAGVQHFVWFKDARSLDRIINFVTEYGIKGIAVWNIMYFFLPTWLLINSQYDIVSVLANPTDK